MTIERIQIDPRDREGWLALRRRDVTASDVPIVCGEGGYGSLAELYAEKKGLRPALVDSGVLKRGRWGEAAVFEALAEERPEWQIQRAKVYVRDPTLRLGCTPDGFAIAPDRDGIGVVQGKVVSRYIFRHRWLFDPDDDVKTGGANAPIAYVLQTLTEEMLNDTAWGVLAVLINAEYDWTFRLFDVDRDAEVEQRIRDNVAKFFRDHLDVGIMPEFDPQRDEELIRLLYPKDDGSEIDLTTDNRAQVAVEELIETQAAVKRLKKSEDILKTELVGKLGEHTYGRFGNGQYISWKLQQRKAFSVAPSAFRVLRIQKRRAT
jgi:predicted phage-related endonuclease